MKTVLLKLYSVLLEITRTTLCRQDCEETHLTGPSVPVLRKPASALITQFLCEVCNTHSYFDNGQVTYAAVCAKKTSRYCYGASYISNRKKSPADVLW